MLERMETNYIFLRDVMYVALYLATTSASSHCSLVLKLYALRQQNWEDFN